MVIKDSQEVKNVGSYLLEKSAINTQRNFCNDRRRQLKITKITKIYIFLGY